MPPRALVLYGFNAHSNYSRRSPRMVTWKLRPARVARVGRGGCPSISYCKDQKIFYMLEIRQVHAIVLFYLRTRRNTKLFGTMGIYTTIRTRILLPRPLLYAVQLSRRGTIMLTRRIFRNVVCRRKRRPHPGNNHNGTVGGPNNSMEGYQTFAVGGGFCSNPHQGNYRN